jgi:hypothetical protein
MSRISEMRPSPGRGSCSMRGRRRTTAVHERRSPACAWPRPEGVDPPKAAMRRTGRRCRSPPLPRTRRRQTWPLQQPTRAARFDATNYAAFLTSRTPSIAWWRAGPAASAITPEYLHDPARRNREHDHPVGEIDGLVDIVRYQEGRDLEAASNILHEILKVSTGLRIDEGKRAHPLAASVGDKRSHVRSLSAHICS